MIIDKEKEQERCEALKKAFSEKGFQDELDHIRLELEKSIDSWANGMDNINSRINNVYSVESRVKDVESFVEKLFRKNYIRDWDVFDDIAENQRYIKHELTDLIGIRVNCYFEDYEKKLYDFFWSTTEEMKDLGFELKKENTKQKNKNTIWKFSGLYKETYHFEIQIKSIVHNVWGEVEHKTVYKNPTYDGFFEKKKLISRTLHDVMLASDRELFNLFNMTETEDQLLRSLFFIKTKDFVAQKCDTTVLGEHYNSYFLAFPEIEPIKKYLVCVLSGKALEQDEIKVKPDAFYLQLRETVIETFPKFYFNCLYHIDNILHKHESFDTFLLDFLQRVIHHETDSFDEAFAEDFNGEEGGETLKTDSVKDYLVKIDSLLGTKLYENEDNGNN